MTQMRWLAGNPCPTPKWSQILILPFLAQTNVMSISKHALGQAYNPPRRALSFYSSKHFWNGKRDKRNYLENRAIK